MTEITPSLILAVIALSFSVWQYFDRKATDNSLRQSRIILRLGALRDIDLIFKKVNITNEVIFKQRYRCVLSNIGYVDEEIVFCDVYNLVLHEFEGKNKPHYAMYAGMNPQLVDENGEDISFPINIAARKSITLYIDIGMIVPRLVWEIVKDKIQIGESLVWQEAEEIFSIAGYPCFGQLTYSDTVKSDSYSVNRFSQGDYYQSFWIRFFKSDNSYVTGEFSLMGNDMNIQGEK